MNLKTVQRLYLLGHLLLSALFTGLHQYPLFLADLEDAHLNSSTANFCDLASQAAKAEKSRNKYVKVKGLLIAGALNENCVS